MKPVKFLVLFLIFIPDPFPRQCEIFWKVLNLLDVLSFLHPYLGPGTVLNAAMASASIVPCPVGTVYNPHFTIIETVALGGGVFPKVTHLVEGRTEDYRS